MWSAIIPTLMQAGVGLIGAHQAGEANAATAREAYGYAGYVSDVGDYQAGLGDQAASTIVDANNVATAHELAAVNDYIAKMYGGMAGLLDLNTDVYKTNIATIDQGVAEAQGRLDQISADAAPGYRFLRETIADPYSLRDAQRYELDELRDSTKDHIRTSSLAGSGRTAAALIKDVESNYVLQAQEANRLAGLEAARLLYGDYSAAARGGVDLAKAATDARVGANTSFGQNAAQVMDSYGRDIAGATRDKGTIQANQARDNATAQVGALENRSRLAGVTADAYGTAVNTGADARAATTKAYGQTMGDIASTIASQSRESRYQDRLKKLEKQVSRLG